MTQQRRPRVRVLPPLRRIPAWRVRLLAVLAVLGPGLVSGFADNDAGGITTYSLAGANYGYALLWVILASQLVLFFTQEVGARLGLATGKGLMGLIRERWGVRWGAFAALVMLVANLGSTVAEFAGIGSALGIFGVPPQVSAAVAAVVVVGFIALGSYGRVQYFFVAVGVAVSVAYVVSAFMADPDWAQAAESMLHPQLSSEPPTGWPSSAPSAPRSRPGGRPSSSPTSPTRACARMTSRPAGSTSSPGPSSRTSSPASSSSPARRPCSQTGSRSRAQPTRHWPWSRSPGPPPRCSSPSGSSARRSSAWASSR